MDVPASAIEEPKDHCGNGGAVVGVDRDIVIGDTRVFLVDLRSCQAIGVCLLSGVDVFSGHVEIRVMI